MLRKCTGTLMESVIFAAILNNLLSVPTLKGIDVLRIGVVSFAHFMPSGLFQSKLLFHHFHAPIRTQSILWKSIIYEAVYCSNKYFLKNRQKRKSWEIILDMKRGHAHEKNLGFIGINIFVDPFWPCPQNSFISYWPFNFIIFCRPFIEWPPPVRWNAPTKKKKISTRDILGLFLLTWRSEDKNWIYTYRTFMLTVFIHQI